MSTKYKIEKEEVVSFLEKAREEGRSDSEYWRTVGQCDDRACNGIIIGHIVEDLLKELDQEERFVTLQRGSLTGNWAMLADYIGTSFVDSLFENKTSVDDIENEADTENN